jgi:fructoselysine-6-P-deglycase FrlB-like protein
MADPIAIPDDFEDSVQAAVDQSHKAQDLVASAVAKGLDSVYLVGCGGSHFGMYPAFELLDRYGSAISTARMSSAEFTARPPVHLGRHSLVIAASHSGNTPETVAAARFARERGATVAGISRVGDNGLASAADVHFDYPDTITITEPKLVHTAQLVTAVLQQTGDGAPVEALAAAIPALPHAFHQTKIEAAETGEAVADAVAAAPLSYVVGAGPAFGMAKMMAWCYFQEMQWMSAAVVNGADYFHGPLEMTMDDTPIVVLLAEDPTRPLGERVVRFTSRVSSQARAIDTRLLTLPGIPEVARPELSVFALMSFERRVLDHVAARRGHDTSVRRYMYKVEY